MESLLLRKIKEESHGHPVWWIWRSGVYALVTMFVPLLFIIIFDSLIIRGIFALILAMFGVIYLKNLSNAERWIASVKRWRYMIRSYRGETIISKYNVPPSFLNRMLKIINAHPNGIIEFTGGRYGAIWRLWVPGDVEGGLEAFIPIITTNLVNRIIDSQTMKVFAMTKKVDSLNILDELVQSMNDSSKSIEQIKHLESIHKQLSENIKVQTKREIYMFIGLGFFDTLQESEIALNNLLPTLNDGFMLSKITGVRVIDPNEISLVYRECIA